MRGEGTLLDFARPTPDQVLDVITASGLLPAGTAVLLPADTNGVGLEIRYLVRR